MSTGTEPTARRFISVQFTDIFWERILKEGYRIFILYGVDGEEKWTQAPTFHANIQMATLEVMEIIRDGINDTEDGYQRDIRKIVICRYPIDIDEKAAKMAFMSEPKENDDNQ